VWYARHDTLVTSHYLMFLGQMVLDAGHLVEFDSPATLLKKEGGLFRGMVDESMDRDKLRTMAGL
jgi:ABC-type multidrug transport system fused ATPase/permease subunit